MNNNGFEKKVGEKEERLLKAKKEKNSALHWFGVMGIVGWSVTLPMVGGVFLGRWIDSTWPGKYSFTVMLLFAGLVLGCWNAWFWVKKASGGNEGAEEKNEHKP